MGELVRENRKKKQNQMYYSSPFSYTSIKSFYFWNYLIDKRYGRSDRKIEN